MLEGLEAVELLLSRVKKINNSTFRFDSEFYLKIYDVVFRKLLKHESVTIQKVSSWITQGPNPTFVERGLPCLTGRNINSGRVVYENADNVTDEEFNNHKNYKLQFGDILITLKGKGSVGKIGFVYDNRPAIFSRDIGIIRSAGIDPSYLHVFLISKYGKLLVDRGETGGTGQSTLTTTHLKENILVPRLNIETNISDLHLRSEKLYANSNEIYTECEELLLLSLGLLNWTSTQEKTSIKKFSKSFTISGRLDAEYYQPKFDEIENKIKCYADGYKSFHNCITIYDQIFNPLPEKEYNYIELADIGSSGQIVNATVDFGVNLPGRARRLISTNDVIISSIEGSLNKCALVSSNYDKSLCSTGFYVLRSEEILPEILLLLFKSFPFQALMKGRCSGTILTAISKDELTTIPIPILTMDLQKELAKHIGRSFKLRQESTKLIYLAKRAVEIAIENDEKSAMKFINENA